MKGNSNSTGHRLAIAHEANFHWRAAITAASSRSGAADVNTPTFETCPSASTVTVSTTSACLRSPSAEGG